MIVQRVWGSVRKPYDVWNCLGGLVHANAFDWERFMQMVLNADLAYNVGRF